MPPTQFHRGDRVRHAVRPEWGEGVVEQATAAPGDAQRLVVSFASHGRVTLNTAFASVVPANGSAQTGAKQGWLDRVATAAAATAAARPTRLGELPEACTDPFASLTRKLRATLDLYRFERTPRGLMEWAVAQTGLTDPLSQHSRHELEQQFEQFERARDAHRSALLRDAKRSGKLAEVEALRDELKPHAIAALDRGLRAV